MTKKQQRRTTRNRWVGKDPHAKREASNYERPIPSREFLMDLIAKAGVPLDMEAIATAAGLREPDELEALRRRLRAMERDAQVHRNRRGGYGLIDKLELIQGRIIAHPDGFGFLVPDDGSDDLFLSAREMRSLFHGDRVVGRVVGEDRRGRREGSLVEVTVRNTQRVVGRFFSEAGVDHVVADNKRITHDIRIPPGESGGAEPGQIVEVEIIEQPTFRRPPVGRVAEVLGEHMAPGMEIDISIRSHNLPLEWPEDVEQEIAGLKPTVSPAAKRGREDLRALPLVTIDGADSRDFDDAVYCERKAKGWRLIVAIADVSHYVHPGSALDQEAEKRGNSVYFPERVIPMLPEILSNGLCSINPKVDRLCMACEMYITDDGKILRSRFMEGVMKSHARLTYDEVGAMVMQQDEKLRGKYAALTPHLDELHRLYLVMRQQRESRGAIDFDTTETRIVFGADRKIERIQPVVRNDAHKMIEEAMIAANVASARFLERHKMPTLYRVHEVPSNEKLTQLREFLGELGLQLSGGDEPEAQDYAKLLSQVQGRPDAHLIQTVMLRSLMQAQYSPKNVGHFGLALPQYLHFTSPIRRYPDLLVHRAIRHVLRNKDRKRKQKFNYTEQDMVRFGEQCSTTERRADEATRDATDWLKCEYMMDKVGNVYPGIITSVTSFGIFIELEDIFVEGLVHVTALHNDYYHFDATHHRLVGERTGAVFRLGDRVEVRVARVSLDDRKIDFDLVTGGGGKKSSSSEARSEKVQRRSDKKDKGKSGPKSKRGGRKNKQDSRKESKSRSRRRRRS